MQGLANEEATVVYSREGPINQAKAMISVP